MAEFASPVVNDIYALHGRHLIEATLRRHHLSGGRSALHDPGRFPESKCSHRRHGEPTVGILGAGIGGLYTALILESLGIKYEIFEEDNRTGGRLFTHKFEKGGKYDYFDVGAMRYPQTDIMRRLFHLFHYPPLNEGNDGLASHLIPYFFAPEKDNALMYFNDIRARKNSDEGQNFGWDQLGVGEPYLKATVEAILNDVLNPYTTELERDLAEGGQKGWDLLMTMNAYSARGYMSTKYIPSPNLGIPSTHLPTNVVNWCETFDTSTGSYDRAFSEMVLDAMAFATDQSTPVSWKCLDGGSQTLSNSVEQYLRAKGGKIHLNHRVTAIAHNKKAEKMEVGIHADGKDSIHSFDHVITTLPLPCMRTLNLQQSGMSLGQANALRQLTYGPSTKIGVRFKSAWWSTANDLNGNPIDLFGGQSTTDRPVRMIVYPSYGNGTGHTMIASYAWTDDAQRFGALMGTGKQEFEDQIKVMVLRDLALVHNVDLKWLTDEYEEHFAWDWHHPRSMGAFAFFGPGLFELPYESLTLPAPHGQLHFAGEALSVRHAWVVGALDSAWRAVKEMLCLVYGPTSEQTKKFHALWGDNQEWKMVQKGHMVPKKPRTPQDGDDDVLDDDMLLRHLRFGRPEVFE